MTLAQAFRTWTAHGPRDLGARHWARGVWAVGAILIAIGFVWDAGRAPSWAVAFGTSGVLCVANAIRSRRFHCMLTGPIFLVGAVLVTLRALHAIALSWSSIGGGVVGAVVATLVLEMAVCKKSSTCC